MSLTHRIEGEITTSHAPSCRTDSLTFRVEIQSGVARVVAMCPTCNFVGMGTLTIGTDGRTNPL